MSYRCFEVDVTDKVAHIRLSRPDELNTMVPEFWNDLPVIIGELSDSGGVRAAVISSSGRHFSAGMDLSVFTSTNLMGEGEAGRRNAGFSQLVRRLQDSFTALERARIPVLAAVQGGCIGGAVDMVCAADMRYATEDAFFVVQETAIGMTADVGTLQRLPKLVPDGVAREMVYTGRRLDARRAYEIGLVN
ncbi:MAG: enoyl-CoA hydratase-related protein [Candidatus Nanopelagicales bacterium]